MRSSLKYAIKNLGKIDKAVEIGVQRGRNAYQLLEMGVKELVLVDPYVPYLVGGFPYKLGGQTYVEDIITVTQEEQNECKRQMFCRLCVHGDKIKVLNTTSVQAAGLLPDGYFDYVYIDGDHKYQAVKEDLNAWFSKVRKGGVLAGHDYTKPHLGVAKAVQEFAKEHNLKALILEQDDNWRKNLEISDWWICIE